ncbi:MAG: hypothetical protein ACI9SI_001160 [Polaribacter sp.]|jgi:hypothetical protein
MKLVILRTDIKTKKKVKKMKTVFNNHPVISKWSIDIEDIDNVLRIEAAGNLHKDDVKRLVTENGFYCEELPDY